MTDVFMVTVMSSTRAFAFGVVTVASTSLSTTWAGGSEGWAYRQCFLLHESVRANSPQMLLSSVGPRNICGILTFWMPFWPWGWSVFLRDVVAYKVERKGEKKGWQGEAWSRQ